MQHKRSNKLETNGIRYQVVVIHTYILLLVSWTFYRVGAQNWTLTPRHSELKMEKILHLYLTMSIFPRNQFHENFREIDFTEKFGKKFQQNTRALCNLLILPPSRPSPSSEFSSPPREYNAQLTKKINYFLSLKKYFS